MSAVELSMDADESDVAPSDGDFVLAHLSDLHLSTLRGVHPFELMDKRILGYLSWRQRRRCEHRSDVLDVLRADLHSERPDHITVRAYSRQHKRFVSEDGRRLRAALAAP